MCVCVCVVLDFYLKRKTKLYILLILHAEANRNRNSTIIAHPEALRFQCKPVSALTVLGSSLHLALVTRMSSTEFAFVCLTSIQPVTTPSVFDWPAYNITKIIGPRSSCVVKSCLFDAARTRTIQGTTY